jgi:hypothetical protein
LLTASAASEIDFDVAVTPVIVSDTLVTVSADPSTGGVSFSAGGSAQYAALPIDAQGNAVANIVPRTGTLASLLALSGGVGEISSATDVHSLVKHNGVAGGAQEINAHHEITYYGPLLEQANRPSITPVAGTTSANSEGCVAIGRGANVRNDAAAKSIEHSLSIGYGCNQLNASNSFVIGVNAATELSGSGDSNVNVGSYIGGEPLTTASGISALSAWVTDDRTNGVTLATTISGAFINCGVEIPDGMTATRDLTVIGGDYTGALGFFRPPFGTGTYLATNNPDNYMRVDQSAVEAVGVRLGSNKGTFDRSYQRVTAGTALAVTGGSVIVDFAAGATITLTLPANPEDGQDFEVSNQVAFSAGNIVVNPNATPASQTIVLNTLTTPAAGANAAWRYVASATKWCRIR